MGMWMEYDLITGVPLAEIYPDYEISKTDQKKKFRWLNKVRVLKNNNKFTNIGYYDDYGRVIVKEKGKTV